MNLLGCASRDSWVFMAHVDQRSHNGVDRKPCLKSSFNRPKLFNGKGNLLYKYIFFQLDLAKFSPRLFFINHTKPVILTHTLFAVLGTKR